MDDQVIVTGPKAEKGDNIKWIVPLILLVLVLVLVTVVALSDRLHLGFDRTDIVLYSLTALLCTLVAVSLTLTGCREYFMAMIEHAGRIDADMAEIRNEQMRLQDVIESGNRELCERCATLGDTQRLVQEGLRALTDTAQTTASCVQAVGKDQENLRATMATVVREETRELVHQMSSVEEGAQHIGHALTDLRELSQTVASNITRIADDQAGLGQAQQRSTGVLTDIAGQISGVATQHDSLAELFKAHTETFDAHMSALAASRQELDANVDAIKVLTHSAASSITNIADEQAALHRVLRDTTQVLHDSVRAVEDCQQALRAEVDRVAETGQQTCAAATTLAGEQTALHQTMETAVEHLSGKLTTLSENQRILQRGIDYLSSSAREVVDTIDGLAGQQAEVDEVFRANAEDVNSRLSTLTAGQREIGTSIDKLRELSENVVGNVAGIGSDHASLHAALRGASEESANRTASVQERLGALKEGIDGLSDTTSQLVSGQSDMHETVISKNEELSRKMTALLESQLSFHAGVTNLGEKVNRMAKEITDGTAAQNDLCTALQSYTEAVTSQLSGLAVAHEQLDVSVNALRELTETVAGHVSQIAAEQAETHATVEKNAEALADSLTDSGTSRQEVRVELEKIGETSQQVAGALKAMGAQLTATHDLLVTSQDLLVRSREEVAGQLAAVAEGQDTLQGGVENLNDKTNQVARDVAAVAGGQVTLGKALEVHSETVKGQMSSLAAGCAQVDTGVQGLAGPLRTIADQMTSVAGDQVKLQETLQEKTKALTENMATIRNIQEVLRTGFRKIGENDQHRTGEMAALATSQSALEEAINACNEQITSQISALGENQQSLRVELTRVAHTGEQTGTTVATMAETQVALHQAIVASDEELTSRIAAAVENQQKIQTGVSELQDVNRNLADRIGVIEEAQNALGEAFRQATNGLTDQVATLTSNHGQLHSNVNSLRELGQKVTGSIATVVGELKDVRKTLGQNSELWSHGANAVQGKLNLLNAEVKKVAEIGRQAGATVTTMVNQQNALAEALNADREGLAQQVGLLSENQQAGINELKAITGEAAAALMAIDDKQTKLEQDFQAHREKLVADLTAITTAQREWLKRLDVARDRTNAVMASFHALEQEMARLQDNSRASAQNLAELLGAQGQLRTDLEQKISQGLQSISKSMIDILDTRVSLHEPVEAADKGSPDPTEDIAWAIEQLKQRNAAADEPPSIL